MKQIVTMTSLVLATPAGDVLPTQLVRSDLTNNQMPFRESHAFKLPKLPVAPISVEPGEGAPALIAKASEFAVKPPAMELDGPLSAEFTDAERVSHDAWAANADCRTAIGLHAGNLEIESARSAPLKANRGGSTMVLMRSRPFACSDGSAV